jgi:diguanylate cyclase (GGDEF)-like protein
MNKSAQARVAANQMFSSYAQLAGALLDNLLGMFLFDAGLGCLGKSDGMDEKPIVQWLRELKWTTKAQQARRPQSTTQPPKRWLAALPLEQTDGNLLGVLCLQLAIGPRETPSGGDAPALAQKLKPVLDSLYRELAAARPERTKLQALTEQTAELEWLFKVTSDLKGASDERSVVEGLLKSATERLGSGLGTLSVPDRRLSMEYESNPQHAQVLRQAWSQARPHLLSWSQRQRRPLVMNGAGRNGQSITPCKILAVPIVRDTGRVAGLLAFFNTPESPDYANRHTFLARHLGRQMAAIVESQFDLMTGLYTREGLEQMYRRIADSPEGGEGSVIYIDVDHMHVVNELHGFELGNELIVRVADLIGPPLLPERALAARITGDRFVIVLPEKDTRDALGLAQQIQGKAARLVIGPAGNTVEVSISCGIAALVHMPQGLARALAAAELACKTAKSRGRHRIEMYACEDSSMMRRHDDVVAVGQLRDALKSDRLLLYAQRIVPLQNRDLPGGYEILLRLRAADGGVVSPGALITAAQRYQLLPSIDRWVTQRAVQMLTAYRSMLQSRGITLSINLSGQSIGDEELVRQLAQQLEAAHLPAGCLTLELTEQAAISSLARANDMIQRLKPWGCQFALDDFGTGANSLTYLKTLNIGRVKIDGSFVKDIVTNSRSRATVRGIVELARGFSITTVAEYVENDAITAVVRELGVDYAQGYAFGKPEPLDSVLSALARDESRRLHQLFLES